MKIFEAKVDKIKIQPKKIQANEISVKLKLEK